MNKKTLLLTGSTGLFGEHFLRHSLPEFTITGTYHHVPPRIHGPHITYIKLDLQNTAAIRKTLHLVKPDIIVHTASIGNVDYCQTHQQEATQINTHATKSLFTFSRFNKTKFVFLSTNAIYDGNHPLYNERSRPNPIDHYGWTKLQAEKKLPLNSSDVLIVRLMTMYGWNNPQERTNPVTWFLQELKNKRELKIVNDIYNNYLYVADAVASVWTLISLHKSGVYNIAGPKVMSRYELARKTAQAFGYSTKSISPVSSEFFPMLAPRPKNTSFDIKKMRRHIQFNPRTVYKGLMDMKKSIQGGSDF